MKTKAPSLCINLNLLEVKRFHVLNAKAINMSWLFK